MSLIPSPQDRHSSAPWIGRLQVWQSGRPFAGTAKDSDWRVVLGNRASLVETYKMRQEMLRICPGEASHAPYLRLRHGSLANSIGDANESGVQSALPTSKLASYSSI